MNFNEHRWSKDEAELLRMLWDQTSPVLSELDIGRRMNRSKNSINSKRKQLKLPGRPSPIPPRRLKPEVLAVDVAIDPEPAVSLPPVEMPLSSESRLLAADATGSGWVSCCWPIGEPGTPAFRFCGAIRADGSVYCPEHHAVGFIRRDRQQLTKQAA
jgi:GcrA cell cycle regulator